jgi:4-hydroxy-3-methylbut-2-enyl diphosphate reductase
MRKRVFSMKVYLPKFTGFCPGVKFAEKSIFELKGSGRNKRIYVLGRLIHNRKYIEYLEREGIVTADSEEEIPGSGTAVIRTHGIDRHLEAKLRKRLEVVDLTCSKIRQLQKYIKRHAGEGYFTVITGKRDHPEVLSLSSYAEGFFIIENVQDIKDFIEGWKRGVMRGAERGKILVVSQTTGKRSLFEGAARQISEAFSDTCSIKVHDSICSITSLREEESLRLQAGADITFVIGDRISANANELYSKLKDKNANTYFIENLDELKALGLTLQDCRAALVVSSSSTPPFVEKETVDYLLAL